MSESCRVNTLSSFSQSTQGNKPHIPPHNCDVPCRLSRSIIAILKAKCCGVQCNKPTAIRVVISYLRAHQYIIHQFKSQFRLPDSKHCWCSKKQVVSKVVVRMDEIPSAQQQQRQNPSENQTTAPPRPAGFLDYFGSTTQMHRCTASNPCLPAQSGHVFKKQLAQQEENPRQSEQVTSI